MLKTAIASETAPEGQSNRNKTTLRGVEYTRPWYHIAAVDALQTYCEILSKRTQLKRLI